MKQTCYNILIKKKNYLSIYKSFNANSSLNTLILLITITIMVLQLQSINMAAVSCENNLGDTLNLCKQSTNSTNTCCLVVHTSAAEPGRCAAFTTQRASEIDNTVVSSYKVYCTDDSGSNTHISASSDTVYKVSFKSTGETVSYYQNCGEVNPNSLNDCTNYSTSSYKCCYILSTISDNKFNVCMTADLDDTGYYIENVYKGCSSEAGNTDVTKDSSSYTISKVYFIFLLTIIVTIF